MDPPDLSAEAVGSALVDARVAPRNALDRSPEVVRLDGGYSWITLRVTWRVGDPVIVRVAPVGGTVEPYDPEAEARRLRVIAGVVPAPEVLAVCEAPNHLGRPFGVHSLVAGDAQRHPADPAPYRRALATALGTLHSRADPSVLDDVADIGAAYEAELGRAAEAYRRCWRHPGIDVALRWLAAHRPPCKDRPAICHGDFRPANVLWTAPGVIGGIIDWERAWVGDPLCDVAFSMHLGGWGAIEGDAVAPYRAAGGAEIDGDRLRYALRFERVRSYLSGMQGLAAVAAGRAGDQRLVAIGRAAQAGAWQLVDWLAPDLPPLGDVLVPPDSVCPLHTGEPLMISSQDMSRSGSEPAAPAPPRSRPTATDADLPAGWRELTERAATGGPELIEPLRRLARRDTPPPGRGEVRWRDS